MWDAIDESNLSEDQTEKLMWYLWEGGEEQA